MVDTTGRVSGIAPAHARAIAEVAERMNCFIFIRPSTDDTVRLIEAGFATKSNDVHDKSSDWGPMAGFVPVDQGLNKKNKAPKLDAAGIDAHRFDRHGIEEAVHLTLTPQLAAQQPMTPLATPPAGAPAAYQYFQSRKHATPAFARNKATGRMYWWDPAARGLVKLMVWGYHGVPITGDYDLWMVAPHMDNAQRFGLEQLAHIYGTVDEHNSVSASTPFLLKLNTRLNRACRKAIPGSQQVFNHGAEAQNYGFTQALDPELAMFTPGGTMRNITTGRPLARALNEMEHRGYLVIRNKRWLEGNVHLSGEKTTDGHHFWKLLRAHPLDRQYGVGDIARVQMARSEIEKKQKSQYGPGGQRIWASADDQKGYEGNLAARRDLDAFRRAMQAERTRSAHELHALRRIDFPEHVQVVFDKQLQALRAAADHATDTVFGAGQNRHTAGSYDITGMGSSSFPSGTLQSRPLREIKKH